MSASVNANGLPGDYDRRDGVDVDVVVVKEELNDVQMLHRGNTVRLAALFGDVRIGAKRQKSVEEGRSDVKVVTVTKHHNVSSSDSDGDHRKVTVTKVTKVTREAHGSSSSSSSSDDERKVNVKTVTVAKQHNKEVVVVKGKVQRERRDSSSSEGRREQRKDNAKGGKQVTVIKREVNRQRSDSSSSDEERAVVKRETVKKVSTASRAKEEVKEHRKEKAKEAVKEARESSSDSEGRRRVVVTKQVTKTTVVKVGDRSSDSDDERVSRREVTKKVVKKDEKKQRRSSSSDSSDSEGERKSEKVTKVEKVKTGKVKAEKVKAVVESKRHSRRDSSSSSSSDDEGRRESKHVKVEKVTKVIKDGRSSSSSDDERSKAAKVEAIKARAEREKPRARRVLVVSAHVTKASHEGALFKAALNLLKAQGAEVRISNLYHMEFNPVASPSDFGSSGKEREFYNYALLSGRARREGRLARDIVDEQEKVEWADLLLIISPIQSHGLPAILKGWFDRVFTYDFAFTETEFYERGKLRDKRALLCLTSPGLASMYTPQGIHGDLDVYLWPIMNGILRFVGLHVLKSQVFFGGARDPDGFREAMLAALERRFRDVWSERPLAFIAAERFRERRGYVLSSRGLGELRDAGRLTVAQYDGKRAPDLAFVVHPEILDEVRDDHKSRGHHS